jgi:hypothetical protein
VLKRLGDNTTSPIEFKRDSSSNAIPCAFTSTIEGVATEFRVSEGGIGAWKQASDFGLVVPAQKSRQLIDPSFAGTYPALAFIREKTQRFRAAAPIRYEIDSNGGMKAYSCDMTKPIPDCTTSISSSNAETTTCIPQSDGTLSCTSSAGLVATGLLYVTGSNATMFMSVSNMSVGSYRFGGLLIMSKAARMSLPNVGRITAANSSWSVGVNPSGNVVVSGGTSGSTVESVSAANNSYTTISSSSSTVYTRYINTPTNGLLFSTTSNSKGITLGSPSGWAVAASDNGGSEFDGWYAYVRAKR